MFADDTIIYVENQKEPTKKVLELISDYSKVVKYQVNKHKSIAFLYANNEQVEFEFDNKIPCTLPPSRMKYLGINKSNKIGTKSLWGKLQNSDEQNQRGTKYIER